MSDLGDRLAKIGAELNDEEISSMRRECDKLRGRNVVHKEELRELIEQWEYRCKGIMDFQGRSPEVNEIQKCIDELEALLDE